MEVARGVSAAGDCRAAGDRVKVWVGRVHGALGRRARARQRVHGRRRQLQSEAATLQTSAARSRGAPGSNAKRLGTTRGAPGSGERAAGLRPRRVGACANESRNECTAHRDVMTRLLHAAKAHRIVRRARGNDCTRHGNDCTSRGNGCTRLGNDCTRHGNDCTRHGNDSTRRGRDCTRRRRSSTRHPRAAAAPGRWRGAAASR
jgi:hypothetical protein